MTTVEAVSQKKREKIKSKLMTFNLAFQIIKKIECGTVRIKVGTGRYEKVN